MKLNYDLSAIGYQNHSNILKYENRSLFGVVLIL